jgi:hypothetical protein
MIRVLLPKSYVFSLILSKSVRDHAVPIYERRRIINLESIFVNSVRFRSHGQARVRQIQSEAAASIEFD